MLGTIDEHLLVAGGVSVTCEKRSDGHLVTIELIRERALNALLSDTFRAFHAVLDALPAAPARVQVLFCGRGRAFSAGGDVRALRGNTSSAGPVASDARRAAAHAILKTEYDLLTRLARLPGRSEGRVATVGVADGYAFGAGNGLLQACGARLVTDRAVIGMPECTIGLVPDCGASAFYARLPGAAGMFAAVTGKRFAAGDALALGLADGVAPRGWRGDGATGIQLGDDVSLVADGADAAEKAKQALSHVTTPLADSGSAARREIDDCFGRDSLHAIRTAVEQYAAQETTTSTKAEGAWAVEALKAMREGAPRAVAETVRSMREGYACSGDADALEQAVARELATDTDLAARWDFEEGVRALLVDKDFQPKWESYP